MQAISITPAVANTTTISADVKNDTTALPKSKLNIKLGDNANFKLDEKTTISTPLQRLQSMELESRNWEITELAASNKRLYSILADAYSYYQTLKNHSNKIIRNQYASDLNRFITERKYIFTPTSHDMIRVVKCVFGADRRRVSAYSIALREALRQKVDAKDLALFIEQNGGVEQIRLGGTKPLSAKIRAEKVMSEVLSADLGMIKFDDRLVRTDADWADKQVVIVATYLSTGQFQANAVIRHDTAVNAALATYFSQQQASVRAVAKAKRDTDKKHESDMKKNATKVRRLIAQNAPDRVISERKKRKVIKEQLTADCKVAYKAFAETLLA